MSKFIIYALHHPDSPHVYVGRSSKGLVRPKEHGEDWNLKKFPHYPIVRWIMKRRGLGQKYQIAVLEECASADDLNAAEKFHIAYLKSLGIPLLNCTEGGDGISGHKFSEESKAEMSRTRKGRKLSEEAKEHLRRINTGKKMSPEAIAKTRAAHFGKKRSPEICKRLSEAHKGTKLSLEHRANISAANKKRVYPKGYKRSPEAIANSAAAHVGLKRTSEQKATMKAAQQKRQAEARKQKLPRIRINLLGAQ